MRRKKTMRHTGTLSERRLDTLSTTINDLFEKAVRNEQIMRRYQQFELNLLDTNGLAQLLDMLLINALEYFGLDQIELFLYDPQGTLAELIDDQHAVQGLHIVDSNQTLQLLYGRRPEVRLIANPATHQPAVFGGSKLRSAALLPLLRHDILVGSYHFGASAADRFSVDKSTDFIAHLASVISVCLENAVNHERLHRLSMLDMLTQVKNRRAFHRALNEEVSRAGRAGDPLSLLFIDLDHFKRVNDQYGHPMGDRVLKTIAQLIQTQLRKTDHVCRYGGEEFALVLPNCSKQRALEVAERLRRLVEATPIADDTDQVTVTLSVGVSCWLAETPAEDEQQMARQLIESSDRGVYQSKAAGRNSVHFVSV